MVVSIEPRISLVFTEAEVRRVRRLGQRARLLVMTATCPLCRCNTILVLERRRSELFDERLSCKHFRGYCVGPIKTVFNYGQIDETPLSRVAA